ncbi:MAG: biotin--[acetyl-CoA-carboxylase] ligase [Parvibaculales bacterium]
MSGFPEGVDYLTFETLDSTNAQARRVLGQGRDVASVPVWIRADTQTAGRGRMGRTWSSPVGNLMATYVCAPECERHHLAEIGFVAGLALHDTLSALAPDSVIGLKWPNDVLLEGAKVSGILLETLDQEMRHVAVGIGVNLSSAPSDTPYPAIALKSATGQNHPPEGVLSQLAHRFLYWQKAWEDDGFAALRAPWLARAHGLGAAITVRQQQATVEGVFADITEDGRLLVETEQGGAVTVSAGDVYFGAGL